MPRMSYTGYGLQHRLARAGEKSCNVDILSVNYRRFSNCRLKIVQYSVESPTTELARIHQGHQTVSFGKYLFGGG